MAKSRRVTFDPPPASHRVLEQAAQENGINVPAVSDATAPLGFSEEGGTQSPRVTCDASAGATRNTP